MPQPKGPKTKNSERKNNAQSQNNFCKEDFQLYIHLIKDSTRKRPMTATPVELLSLQEYWDISFNDSLEKMASCENVTNLYSFFTY